MSEFVAAARIEEIPENGGLAVRVKGREVALFRTGGRVYAIDNVCLHRGGPLAEGQLEGCVVSCPFHAWTFDVRTGVCTFNDEIRQESFETRLAEGKVLVKI